MKVFTIESIREADAYTIKNEPIKSVDLMERASKQIAEYILINFSKKNTLLFLIGKGNNAGDGLAAARMCAAYGYAVHLHILLGKNGSDDFKTNLYRLSEVSYTEVSDIKSYQDFSSPLVIVDALFGSGLDRPIEGTLANILQEVNRLNAFRLAIDIPSGMYADKSSEDQIVFQADLCISFQFPKLAFFAPENHKHIKDWIVKDIGLHPEFIANKPTDYQYTTDSKGITSAINAFSHKGDRGRIGIIAGGYGRMGAALLAAKAAMRAGGGLITVQSVDAMIPVIHSSLPEALILQDTGSEYLQQKHDYTQFDTLVVGPALGATEESVELLRHILLTFTGKLILDADAITILAKHHELIEIIPEDAILTPHIGEFDRLISNQGDFFSRLMQLKTFCKHRKVNMVLKGKYSAVCDKQGNVHFNSTGNNGLAKGGSGDVLSGMIAGLSTNVKNIFDSIILAVFLHGLSADVLIKDIHINSLLPSDVISGISSAFKHIGWE